MRIHFAASPANWDLLFGPAERDRLRRVGSVSTDDVPADRLLAGYDVVITSWGSRRLPERLPADSPLRLVCHSAGTVRGVVPKSLLADVRAVQASAAMAEAVAEMALTLCLMLLRHAHTFDRALSGSRDWAAARKAPLGEALSAQRVGVIGAGRTGCEFIRMVRALGAEVVVFDPYLSAERAAELGVSRAALAELLSGCGIVAVHAPTTDETRGMLGPAEFARIRDGGIVVNTARSAVIDETALVAEVTSGRLRAGLDVYDTEPLPADHPLQGLPNVVLSPHQAGATSQARRRQGSIVVEEIERYCRGEQLRHEITTDNYDVLA